MNRALMYCFLTIARTKYYAHSLVTGVSKWITLVNVTVMLLHFEYFAGNMRTSNRSKCYRYTYMHTFTHIYVYNIYIIKQQQLQKQNKCNKPFNRRCNSHNIISIYVSSGQTIYEPIEGTKLFKPFQIALFFSTILDARWQRNSIKPGKPCCSWLIMSLVITTNAAQTLRQ